MVLQQSRPRTSEPLPGGGGGVCAQENEFVGARRGPASNDNPAQAASTSSTHTVARGGRPPLCVAGGCGRWAWPRKRGREFEPAGVVPRWSEAQARGAGRGAGGGGPSNDRESKGRGGGGEAAWKLLSLDPPARLTAKETGDLTVLDSHSITALGVPFVLCVVAERVGEGAWGGRGAMSATCVGRRPPCLPADGRGARQKPGSTGCDGDCAVGAPRARPMPATLGIHQN